MSVKGKNICGCGRPLIPVFDGNGKRIGFTHNTEDDDWHCEYFRGLSIILSEGKP